MLVVLFVMVATKDASRRDAISIAPGFYPGKWKRAENAAGTTWPKAIVNMPRKEKKNEDEEFRMYYVRCKMCEVNSSLVPCH